MKQEMTRWLEKYVEEFKLGNSEVEFYSSDEEAKIIVKKTGNKDQVLVWNKELYECLSEKLVDCTHIQPFTNEVPDRGIKIYYVGFEQNGQDYYGRAFYKNNRFSMDIYIKNKDYRTNEKEREMLEKKKEILSEVIRSLPENRLKNLFST